MTYIVTGIARETYASLFDLSDAELAARGARRVTAGADGGYPCRVSLEEARAGERLVLVNHASNAVEGPYLSAFAIFVRERAEQAGRPGEAVGTVSALPTQPGLYRATDHLLKRRVIRQETLNEARIVGLGATQLGGGRCAVRFRVAAIDRETGRQLVVGSGHRIEAIVLVGGIEGGVSCKFLDGKNICFNWRSRFSNF